MQSKQQFISPNNRQAATTKVYTGEIECVHSKRKKKTMNVICIRTVTQQVKEFFELNSLDFREK